jgi:hypothetical protein
VVVAPFNDGESVSHLNTYWTNFFLRDFLIMDPSKQSSPQYGQPSIGIPMARAFIIDPQGKVALPYFGHQPQLAIRSLRAFQRQGLTCTPGAATISASAGGRLDLHVDGSPIRRGNVYAAVITLSGTSPGTVIGDTTVPINMDALTWSGLLLAGTPLFPEFIGNLDARGRGYPALVPWPGLIPSPMVGLKIWAAAVTFDPTGPSTSPAAEVTIVK